MSPGLLRYLGGAGRTTRPAAPMDFPLRSFIAMAAGYGATAAAFWLAAVVSGQGELAVVGLWAWPFALIAYLCVLLPLGAFIPPRSRFWRASVLVPTGIVAGAAVAWIVGAVLFDIRRPALVMLLWSTCNGAITGWVLARFVRSWLREFDRGPEGA